MSLLMLLMLLMLPALPGEVESKAPGCGSDPEHHLS
jgi:hypothetical protein